MPLKSDRLVTLEEAQCTRCGQVKKLKDFWKVYGKPASRCIECRNELRLLSRPARSPDAAPHNWMRSFHQPKSGALPNQAHIPRGRADPRDVDDWAPSGSLSDEDLKKLL